ncbi:MAG: MazG family protein [Nocardioidaceae bacterium]
MTDPAGDRLLEFLQVMRRLRVECGWKSAQTHRSLVRYLLEEAHETAEAIESGDPAHLREELGDLLLQIWFHAVIAEEAGEFTLDDVAAEIIAKMHRRNPHVFGADASGDTLDPATINEVWESIKATEKERTSPTDGLPTSLPALLYADKVLDRLSRERGEPVGAPRPGTPPGSERTPPTPAEVGDRLLGVVAEAREAGVDPEQALRDAVRRLLG